MPRKPDVEVRKVNIIVCVKQVPDVTDADLEIDETGTGIHREDLVMDINEWDNYAVEEAVRIKEATDGKVSVISLGDEDAEEVLRRALAMGADEAILIDSEGFEGADTMRIAHGIYHAIKDRSFDLVLTGAQSSDNGSGQVGPLLAQWLGLPHATLALETEVTKGSLIVLRELESNLCEKVEIPIPAVVSVQTGINQPRYVSVMGIRKARRIGIETTDRDTLGIAEDRIGREASDVAQIRLSVAQTGRRATILEGSLTDICDKMAEIIRVEGGVS